MKFDHCDNLIHFTKGNNSPKNYEEAYLNFKKIIKEEKLKGNDGMILGSHKCVCFTESPARCLTNDGRLDSKLFSRYAPFGFQYQKKKVFKQGGRPVIYSKRSEYDIERNNANLNWRFVNYDPEFDGKRDFTWEREWRIKSDEIPVEPRFTKLVFPNKKWIDRFIYEHELEYHGDCEDCMCTREATIINFTDFVNSEDCENISGTCPDPEKFPWILINMNEKE
ncbi:MAG: hypothetical protein ACSHXA_15375 [Polaribacter sp.]|uniref:hypothetical protein n=1 Tax=Polaribacter sp. TaxID=1920175 RepID=UPI003EF6A583